MSFNYNFRVPRWRCFLSIAEDPRQEGPDRGGEVGSPPPRQEGHDGWGGGFAPPRQEGLDMGVEVGSPPPRQDWPHRGGEVGCPKQGYWGGLAATTLAGGPWRVWRWVDRHYLGRRDLAGVGRWVGRHHLCRRALTGVGRWVGRHQYLLLTCRCFKCLN